MISIRGAITVDQDSRQEVLKAAKNLLENMMKSNSIGIDEIISVIFTCTRDIKSAYPAEAAREIGITRASLMCVNEMYVDGSLEMCIRVMMLAEKGISQSEVKHIYLGKATSLRPDLASDV